MSSMYDGAPLGLIPDEGVGEVLGVTRQAVGAVRKRRGDLGMSQQTRDQLVDALEDYMRGAVQVVELRDVWFPAIRPHYSVPELECIVGGLHSNQWEPARKALGLD